MNELYRLGSYDIYFSYLRPPTYSREKMIVGVTDCCSSLALAASVHQLSSCTSSRFQGKPLRFNYLNSLNNNKFTPGCCRANLITDSESFQVGKLIGTYGFMNITRYYFITFLSLLSFYFCFQIFMLLLDCTCIFIFNTHVQNRDIWWHKHEYK